MPARSSANTALKIALFLVLFSPCATPAESADLKFTASQKPGQKDCFDFDTGTLRGTLRLDGKGQGVSSLLPVPSGVELAYDGLTLEVES